MGWALLSSKVPLRTCTSIEWTKHLVSKPFPPKRQKLILKSKKTSKSSLYEILSGKCNFQLPRGVWKMTFEVNFDVLTTVLRRSII